MKCRIKSNRCTFAEVNRKSCVSFWNTVQAYLDVRRLAHFTRTTAIEQRIAREATQSEQRLIDCKTKSTSRNRIAHCTVHRHTINCDPRFARTLRRVSSQANDRRKGLFTTQWMDGWMDGVEFNAPLDTVKSFRRRCSRLTSCAKHLTVEFYTVVMLLTFVVLHHPSLLHSRLKTLLFCKSLPP